MPKVFVQQLNAYVNFPDSMSQADIDKAISERLPAQEEGEDKSWWRRLGDSAVAGSIRLGKNIAADFPSLFDVEAYDINRPDGPKGLKDIEAVQKAARESQIEEGKYLEELAKKVKPKSMGLEDVHGFGDAAMYAGETFMENAPQLAMQAILPPPAGVAMTYAQLAGSNIDRQREEIERLKEEGRWNGEEESRASALAMAVPQTAVEYGLGAYPALRKVFSQKAALELEGKAFQEALKAAPKLAERNIAKAAGIGALKAMAGEGLEEGAQQFGERLQAPGISAMPESWSWGDPAIREYLNSIVGGAIVGGPTGTLGGVSERNRARQLTDAMEAYEQRQRALGAPMSSAPPSILTTDEPAINALEQKAGEHAVQASAPVVQNAEPGLVGSILSGVQPGQILAKDELAKRQRTAVTDMVAATPEPSQTPAPQASSIPLLDSILGKETIQELVNEDEKSRKPKEPVIPEDKATPKELEEARPYFEELRKWLTRYGLSDDVSLSVVRSMAGIAKKTELIKQRTGESAEDFARREQDIDNRLEGMYLARRILMTHQNFDPSLTLEQNQNNMRRLFNHEAIHAMRQLGLLPDSQFNLLVNYGKKHGIGAQAWEAADQVQANEEIAADTYAAWFGGSPLLHPAGAPRKALQKIQSVFQGMGNFFRGYGYDNAERVMNRIGKGTQAKGMKATFEAIENAKPEASTAATEPVKPPKQEQRVADFSGTTVPTEEETAGESPAQASLKPAGTPLTPTINPPALSPVQEPLASLRPEGFQRAEEGRRGSEGTRAQRQATTKAKVFRTDSEMIADSIAKLGLDEKSSRALQRETEDSLRAFRAAYPTKPGAETGLPGRFAAPQLKKVIFKKDKGGSYRATFYNPAAWATSPHTFAKPLKGKPLFRNTITPEALQLENLPDNIRQMLRKQRRAEGMAENAPVKKAELKKFAEGVDYLRYPTTLTPKGHEVADRMADEIVSEVNLLREQGAAGDTTAGRVEEQKAWYTRLRDSLRRNFGGSANLYADIVAATSANEAVKNNVEMSDQAIENFTKRLYDEVLKPYLDWINAGNNPSKYKGPVALKINGKRFGLNSLPVMRAMLGLFSREGAPKTQTFSENQVGASDLATIDVWAGRMLARIREKLYGDSPWNIPAATGAVTGKRIITKAHGKFNTDAYRFGQEVFQRAADKLGMKPHELQAMVWFLEKDLWTRHHLTSAEGEGGDMNAYVTAKPSTRMITGVSPTTNDRTDAEIRQRTVDMMKPAEELARKAPHVRAVVNTPAFGMYTSEGSQDAGFIEQSCNLEVVFHNKHDEDPRRSNFAPRSEINPVAIEVLKAGQSENQDDFIVALTIGKDEKASNARPGLTVYFKQPLTEAEAQGVIKQLVVGSIGGFTAFGDQFNPDKYRGVRMYWMPEFTISPQDTVSKADAGTLDKDLAEEFDKAVEDIGLAAQKAKSLDVVGSAVAEMFRAIDGTREQYGKQIEELTEDGQGVDAALPPGAGETGPWGRSIRDSVEARARERLARWAAENAGAGQAPQASIRAAEAPFYLQVDRALQNPRFPAKAPASQILHFLSDPKHEIKQEEREWLGINDFLKAKGNEPVTRQELVDLVRKNAPIMAEVELDDVHVRFEGDYSTPSTRRYREMIFATPDAGVVEDESMVNQRLVTRSRVREDVGEIPKGDHYADTKRDRRGYAADELFEPVETEPVTRAPGFADQAGAAQRFIYRPHWPYRGLVAHVRFGIQKGLDKLLLYIEEIQSDRHQQARKVGYFNPMERAREISSLHARASKLEQESAALKGEGEMGDSPRRLQIREEVRGILDQIDSLNKWKEELPNKRTLPIPDAPWKSGFHEPIIRRMIRWAVDNGIEEISWAPAKVHSSRYRGYQPLSSLFYKHNADGSVSLAMNSPSGGQVQDYFAQWTEAVEPEDEEDTSFRITKDSLKSIFDPQTADDIANDRGTDAPPFAMPATWKKGGWEFRYRTEQFVPYFGRQNPPTTEHILEQRPSGSSEPWEWIGKFDSLGSLLNEAKDNAQLPAGLYQQFLNAPEEGYKLYTKPGLLAEVQGMKRFYDQTIPNFIKKLANKFGAEIRTVWVAHGWDSERYRNPYKRPTYRIINMGTTEGPAFTPMTRENTRIKYQSDDAGWFAASWTRAYPVARTEAEAQAQINKQETAREATYNEIRDRMIANGEIYERPALVINQKMKDSVKNGIPLFSLKPQGKGLDFGSKPMFSLRESPAPFYSELERTIEAKIGPKATASQALGAILGEWKDNRGNVHKVKQEELAWTGIVDWLKSKGNDRVTKEELLEYVQWNSPEIFEVLRSINDRTRGDTREKDTNDPDVKWASFSTPGAYNEPYYELVFRTPQATAGVYNERTGHDLDLDKNTLDDAMEAIGFRTDRDWKSEYAIEMNTPRGTEVLRRGLPPQTAADDVDKISQYYEHRVHWPGTKGVIGHIRFRIRTLPDGRRIVYVEEMQSDLHQDARKGGYFDPLKRAREVAALQNRTDEIQAEIEQLQSSRPGLVPYTDPDYSAKVAERNRKTEEIRNKIQTLRDERADNDIQIRKLNEWKSDRDQPQPDAPWKTDFHAPMFRRLVKWAAEEGYDGIAWTPGFVQSKRYGAYADIGKINYKLDGDKVTVEIKNPAGEGITKKFHHWLDGHENKDKSIETTPGNLRKVLPGNVVDEILADKGSAEPQVYAKQWQSGLRRFEVRNSASNPDQLLVATQDLNYDGTPHGEWRHAPYWLTAHGDPGYYDSMEELVEWWPQALADGSPKGFKTYRPEAPFKGRVRGMDKFYGTPELGEQIPSTLRAFAQKLGKKFGVNVGAVPVAEQPNIFRVKPNYVVEEIPRTPWMVGDEGLWGLYSWTTYSDGTDGPRWLVNRYQTKEEAEKSKEQYDRGYQEGIAAQEAEQRKQGTLYDAFFLPINEAMRQSAREDGVPMFPSLKPKPPQTAAEKALHEKLYGTRTDAGFLAEARRMLKDNTGWSFRRKALQSWAILERNEMAAANVLGDRILMADSSAHAAASMSVRVNGVMEAALSDGKVEYRGGMTTVDGSGGLFRRLSPLFDGQYELWDQFSDYAAAVRADRLLREGREKLMDPADIALGLSYGTTYPGVRQAFDAYQDWNAGLVQYLIDTGVVERAKGEQWISTQDYVPFYRWIEDEQEASGPTGAGSITGVQAPPKLKGSKEKIAPVMENIIRNARFIIYAGMRNIAAQRAIRDAEAIGYAAPVASRKLPGTISIRIDGKPKYFQISDPLTYDTLTQVEEPLNDTFARIVRPFSNLLREGVTRMPNFWLANIVRDQISTGIITRNHIIPVYDAVKGFAEALKDTPSHKALRRAGVTGGMLFRGDTEDMSKVAWKELRRMYPGLNKGVGGMVRQGAFGLWDALGRMSEISDATTRAAVYDRTLKRTGNEAQAVWEALQVLDFARHGSSKFLRYITASVPFLNARMQGLDIAYRGMRGVGPGIDPRTRLDKWDRVKNVGWVVGKGAMMMALSILYALSKQDDEAYKNARDFERDNYWFFNVAGKTLRFPIPFEMGVLFKVIPERITNYYTKTDTGADVLSSLRRNIESNFEVTFPQVINPIIEVLNNRSAYTGRPIETSDMEGMLPEHRYNEYTSELAKGVGKYTKLSPVKIDHILRGYLGSMSTYLLALTDAIIETAGGRHKPEKKAEEIPFVRSFLQRKDSGRALDLFYALRDDVGKIAGSLRRLETSGADEEAEALEEKHGAKLDLRDELEKTARELTALRKERKAIYDDQTLSPKQKRQELDDIRKDELELAWVADELRREQ